MDYNQSAHEVLAKYFEAFIDLSLIHISEPTRQEVSSRMPSCA